ncbi:MAG: PAS domain S-box protein, partial [Pelovirga sp.]
DQLQLGKYSFLDAQYSYAVKEGQRALLAQFSEGLRLLEQSGEYRRIHDKWLGSYQEQPHTLLVALRYSLLVLIPLVVGLLAVFFWSWMLRRQVARQTRQLRQSEAELRESEQRLDQIIRQGRMIIWEVDRLGRYTYLSPIVEEILGYRPEELINKKHFFDLHPPAGREEFKARALEVFRQRGHFIDFENPALDKAGRIVWFSTSGLPMFSEDGRLLGYRGSDIDISERKAMAAQVQEKKSLLEGLLHNTATPIFVLDPHHRVVAWNEACAELTGIRAAEVLGTTRHWSAFYDQQRPCLADLVLRPALQDQLSSLYPHAARSALVSEGLQAEGWRRLKGEQRYLLFNASAVRNEAGELVAAIETLQDLTGRKQMESALQRKNDEVEQFVYIVSHDLKSPLVTVKSFIGLLQQDIAAADSERIKSDIDYIRSATDKMEQLLEALLQLSRIGRMDRPPQRLALQVLIDETLANLAGALRQYQVDVKVAAGAAVLHGDPLQLGQLWQNLVENAIKYMGDQAAPCIEIGVMARGNDPVFYVRDNGMGIEAKDSERIFGLFTQLEPGTAGSGLGLALVKKIVELYDGTIWVESAGRGRGSCFCFTLPGAVEKRG